ncbi:MAG: molybdopterin-dependent oxidoreductase [Chloroflexi bacterium]|nr:molybdopterin-dependent oxidoreductase [Chloroflexota bacterium]
MEESKNRIVQTSCQLCSGGCGLNLHVEEGRLVRVTAIKEHPVNEGRLCPKALAIPDLVYSQERIHHPLRRDGNSWRQISWEEAMDTIVQRLTRARADFGPEALAVAFGMSFLTQGIAGIDLIRRFTDVYGTPNVFSVDSMCYRSRLIGYILTAGKFFVADAENAKCIVLWGNNPDASCPPVAWRVRKALKQGAKLVVIDPRRIPIAEKADVYLQPRPGTDGALALAFMETLISEGLYDRDFVSRWAVGLEDLKTAAAGYSPEVAGGLAGVPADDIRRGARLFATTKPACIVQGTNTLDQQPAGVQNSRAMAILQALTGNLDAPGGFISPPRLPMRSLRLPFLVSAPPLGYDRFPLFYEVMGRTFGECQSMLLPDAILTGKPYPIKAMIVSASNPLLTWPESEKVRRALESLDFLVVMDMFMTETARLADIVLPAASFAERLNVVDMYRLVPGLPYVMLRPPAVRVGECRSDLDFWLELARWMGYEKQFPWRHLEEAFDYMLEPSGLSVAKLKQSPAGLYYGQTRFQGYEEKGFRTPSGKVELSAPSLGDRGQVPVHREPSESPLSNPDLAAQFPLVLTTGARQMAFLHSQFRQVARLRKLAAVAEAELSPETAAQCGIADGEIAMLETRRGQITVRARVGAAIKPGVVQMSHGWPEANVNLLTSLDPGDPVTGNPELKALLCRMKKVSC